MGNMGNEEVEEVNLLKKHKTSIIETIQMKEVEAMDEIENEVYDKFWIQCFVCKKFGHYAAKCYYNSNNIN